MSFFRNHTRIVPKGFLQALGHKQDRGALFRAYDVPVSKRLLYATLFFEAEFHRHTHMHISCSNYNIVATCNKVVNVGDATRSTFA